MVDQPNSTDPTPGTACPWCSAPLTPGAVVCASCGANLTSDEEHDLPGVTAVDHEILKTVKKPGRSRLMSWINGEYEANTPSLVESGALAPPDPTVQREILRLELEAEVAKLQAEAGARYAEAVSEGRVKDLPDGVEALATGSLADEVLAGIESPAESQPATEPTPPAAEDATGEDTTGEDASGEDATGEDATGEDATGEDAGGTGAPTA